MAALDVAALETALPAATIAAVSGAPAGLTVAATQVYVARKKRPAPEVLSPEAWWRPGDVAPVEGGLGHARRDFRYELLVEKDGATATELAGWRDALLRYFQGACRPFVTGLWAVRVEDLDADVHDGEGPAAAIRLGFTFREV